MTYQEAIQRIEDHMERHKIAEPCSLYITEALQMSIEALEKQIQKVPNRIYICPSCGKEIDKLEKYCDCGQAISWDKEV